MRTDHILLQVYEMPTWLYLSIISVGKSLNNVVDPEAGSLHHAPEEQDLILFTPCAQGSFLFWVHKTSR